MYDGTSYMKTTCIVSEPDELDVSWKGKVAQSAPCKNEKRSANATWDCGLHRKSTTSRHQQTLSANAWPPIYMRPHLLIMLMTCMRHTLWTLAATFLDLNKTTGRRLKGVAYGAIAEYSSSYSLSYDVGNIYFDLAQTKGALAQTQQHFQTIVQLAHAHPTMSCIHLVLIFTGNVPPAYTAGPPGNTQRKLKTTKGVL